MPTREAPIHPLTWILRLHYSTNMDWGEEAPIEPSHRHKGGEVGTTRGGGSNSW